MTELATYQPDRDISAHIEYANAVKSAAMLPQAYRGKPADIMLAVGLGQSMGLSPAESLYRIDVIQGKPTASAELIAANVRKAGHKLRVRGDETTCTATIVRSDDPDFEFAVTRDTEWAKSMGLTTKDNYKKQPGTMLQWRAITAVARLACPEALYGVSYTPDEMGDLTPARPTSTGLGAALANEAPETVTAEQVPHDPEPPQPDDGPKMLDTSGSLAKAMFAAMGEAGITEKDARLELCSEVTGRNITSSTELTEDDARAILDTLPQTLDGDQ